LKLEAKGDDMSEEKKQAEQSETPPIEIKDRWSGAVLFRAVVNTLLKAVEKARSDNVSLRGAYLRGADLRGAYLRGADLRGADLRGADLRGAYLSGADLSGADLSGAYLSGAYLSGADLSGAYLSGAYLSGAYLSGADLSGAYLRGADLSGAYLSGAYLSGAYLSGADLSGAYLSGAYLRGADLSGAIINWASHALIAEILRQAAGDDIEKRMFAGLVAISLDWCWKKFLSLTTPMLDWALDVCAEYVREGDGAPDVLTERVKAKAAASEQSAAAL
jgi:uncharacterized protein YjbI with pentapeptide repeats